MATQRQKQAIQKVVENGGNVSRAMLEAGYSPTTAHTPSKLTRSKAFANFEEICARNGLSPDLLIQSLVEDIKNKPQERVQELALGSKLIGLLDKEKTIQDFKMMVVPSEIALRHGIKSGEIYKTILMNEIMIQRHGIKTPFDNNFLEISDEEKETANKAIDALLE